MTDVIVRCEDHYQHEGTVIAVAASLVLAFGTIAGAVVAYNTIRCADGVIFYLIENVVHAPDVGASVSIKRTLSTDRHVEREQIAAWLRTQAVAAQAAGEPSQSAALETAAAAILRGVYRT